MQLAQCCEVKHKLTSLILVSSHFQLFPLYPSAPPPTCNFCRWRGCSWNGAHHELLLASPGRWIDIIKKPIKLRAGAFITVICEGMGCLFPCAGLTAALVYCWNDANSPTHTHTHTPPNPTHQSIKSRTQPSTSRTRRNVEWLILRTLRFHSAWPESLLGSCSELCCPTRAKTSTLTSRDHILHFKTSGSATRCQLEGRWHLKTMKSAW